MTVEVSSAEIARNFAEFREKAEAEPVVVLHYNKPSVVMVSAVEYARLKRRDSADFKAYLLGGPKVEDFAVARDGDIGRDIAL